MTETERTKPATLVDVARAAGVSVPTASRALNGGVRGKQSGRPELRERVLAAADELGYTPSTAAQAIKGGRAQTIALIVSDIDNIGAAMMIAGVMHAAEERGASVAVRATLDDAERELDQLAQLRGERHRAIVVATSRTTDPVREAAVTQSLELLQRHGARVVVIGTDQMPFPSVVVDTTAAARRLAEALVRAGHRRFAVLTGPTDQITTRDRATGFLDGLRGAGIADADVRIVSAEFSRDGGVAAVDELGDSVRDVDVVAAMSDAMAVGAIVRLREKGIHMPTDVVVTGFDHIPAITDLLPSFSTVEVPFGEFGEAALSLALDEPRSTATSRIALHATAIVDGVPE